VAARVIRANVTAVGLPGAELVTGHVATVLRRGPGRRASGGPAFGVAVADPPYATGDEEVTTMLAALRSGWLACGALVVIERATRSGPVAWPEGYAPDRSRRYGEATFWYGHAAGI
jgi:16S rRNA (guanine966-N2)-methyltransferase